MEKGFPILTGVDMAHGESARNSIIEDVTSYERFTPARKHSSARYIKNGQRLAERDYDIYMVNEELYSTAIR